jgi:hypothetical protein
MELQAKTNAARKVLNTMKDFYRNKNNDYYRHYGGWDKLSCSPYITITNIIETQELFPWDWKSISRNPNLTGKGIRELYTAGRLNSWKRKEWRYALNYLSENYRSHMGLTEGMYSKYPDVCWPWKTINFKSDNRQTPVSIIHINNVIQNKNLPWNWKYATKHVTLDFIKENIKKSWDWGEVSNKIKEEDFSFVKKHKKKKWNWDILSEIVPLKFFLDNITLNWSWDYILSNSNIPMDFIKENMNIPWDWSFILKNRNFDIHFLKEYKDYDWDWDKVSIYAIQNNREFILNNMNMPWNFKIISKYANLQFVIDNPGIEWDWAQISRNKNITTAFISENINKPIEFIHLDDNFYKSDNTMELVKKYPDKGWNYHKLTTNRNLDITFVDIHNKKNWDWYYLTTISKNNEDIIELIKKHPKKYWDFNLLKQINMDLYIELSSKTYFDNNLFKEIYTEGLKQLKNKHKIIANRFIRRKQIGLGM